MRKMHWVRTGLVVGLLSIGSVAFAEATNRPSDQAFLARAIGVNQVELTLGRMAAEHGSAPEVKAVGAKMIENHTALGRELGDLARRSNAPDAVELSPEQRSTVARLSSLSGQTFDASFKTTVDAGHVQELAMYREEVGQAVDPGLRALAQRRVTKLEQTVADSNHAGQGTGDKAKKKEW